MAERTSLSAVLKRYRVAAGLSQETLAARAGLSARAISDLERDLHRAPHAATLDLLATALSLSSQQRAVLLAAAHPELDIATPAQSAVRSHTLPLPPSALIGRERDLAQAHFAMHHNQKRLLTVTGPSGIGKTRLALEIAHDLSSEFGNGAAFVDLAPISDAALVPNAIAQELGLREQANTSSAEQVLASLQDRHILLVLDNCEHLLEAASFVADLLARCPRLSIIVTSRTPLRLRAEQTLPLTPLALEEAIALFRERAQAAQPRGTYDVSEVATICKRVDCLPLAIELAAVQVRVLSLPQIIQHLTQRLTLLTGGARDLPARQRTMEDAIRWSYELLPASQQRCFRALGVFVGGWTLEAAQAICWDEGEVTPQEALLTLAALVDASLVHAETQPGGSVRFHLLELLREYALERLHVAGEEESCRRQHALYYARQAETAAVFGPGQSTAAAQLALDLPNARAALEWAEERREAEIGLRLVGFARLWYIRGQIGEALRWQERMLALDARARGEGEHVAPLTLRSEQLNGIARTLLGSGQLERAEIHATEALQLAKHSGDEERISSAFATLGLIAQAGGEFEKAAQAFTESDAHARLAERSSLRHRALYHLAELARLQGDLDRAIGLFEQALAGARSGDNTWDVAVITTLLGQMAHQGHDYSQARARYQESLALFRAFGSPTYTAWCLEGLAATLCAEGHYTQATHLCAAATELRKQAQTPLPPAEREPFEQTVAAARTALGDLTFEAEWDKGIVLPQDAPTAEAMRAGTHADA